SFMILYIFESAANPAYSALIIDASDEKNRSVIYTCFMWISNVAFAVGSVLGGFFFEKHSAVLFFIVGVSSILSAYCTYYFVEDMYINKIATKTSKADPLIKKAPFSIYTISRIFLFLCVGILLLNLL